MTDVVCGQQRSNNLPHITVVGRDGNTLPNSWRRDVVYDCLLLPIFVYRTSYMRNDKGLNKQAPSPIVYRTARGVVISSTTSMASISRSFVMLG